MSRLDDEVKRQQEAHQDQLIRLFDSQFKVSLSHQLLVSDDDTTYGQILASAVDSTLGDKLYEGVDVISAMRRRRSSTNHFTELTRKAVNAYLKQKGRKTINPEGEPEID